MAEQTFTKEQVLEGEKKKYSRTWGSSYIHMEQLVPNEVALMAMERFATIRTHALEKELETARTVIGRCTKHIGGDIYKMRTEGFIDCFIILNSIPSEHRIYFVITNLEGVIDKELTLYLHHYSIDDFRDMCRRRDDLHVPLQTISKIEDYTGERNYELE